MSGHGISNGEAMRFFETDGRKSASVQESSVYDIAKEKAFSKIRLRDNEIADTRSGFSVFNRKTVKLAKARLRATGVMDAYAIWRHEEGFRQSNGGAPALISVENLLIGWMLVTTAGQPQLILQIGSVFYGMLTDGAREELGLPKPNSKKSLMKVENWQQNVGNAHRRFISIVDPHLGEDRYTAKTVEENAATMENLDEEREAIGKARLAEFMTRFLTMSFYLQPRAIRNAPERKEVDVSFDGTHMSAPLTTGMSHNKDKIAKRIEKDRVLAAAGKPRSGPVSPFAAWKVTETSKRIDAPPGQMAQYETEEDYLWGWNATIARRVFLKTDDRCKAPQLILGATLSIPGSGNVEAAAFVLEQIVRAGHLPGIADADMEYFANAKPERLYDPVRKLGWEASTEWRDDRLGPRGGYAGAIFIESAAYCPAMLMSLQMASKHVKDGEIDEVTYRARVDEREKWEVRPKSRPNADGSITMMCPASGDSPRIKCPLKKTRARVSEAKLLTMDEVDPSEPGYPVGDDLPLICCQDSVKFPKEHLPPLTQALRYKSREWTDFHGYARNLIENGNSMLKAPKYGSLHDHLNRQSRGFASGYVFLTFLLVALNIKQICDFLKAKEIEDRRAAENRPPRKPPIQRRRDRKFFNEYTGTLPGGVPDLEVRQARAKARREKAAKVAAERAAATKTSRSKRAKAATRPA
ncbi:hypothetical protein DEI97_005930 [Curtobacterium sp. MCLR17_032]|uniref:hypothetical protein n=1 Tax=Curtobacterium sp. MCLR17_032 TaxID=2175650 RepID=UPI000DA81B0C|nr:hypothetical protein [Curtobacterium sp. MCLR17_032]WIE62679.1 hypothetical protein DEI97_005930 [Curtobacterium sp. MCLR17_032]